MKVSSPDTRKPSVAIIGTRGYPSYYGGFETAVRRLAPHLVDAGWDVTVYGRPGSTRVDDPTRDSRVTTRVTRGFETKSLSTLSYGFTSTLDAARRKPDVALIMNVANGFWIPFLRMRGIPTLVNVDGIEWDRAKWGRLAKAVFFRGAKATARFATQLVFDAEAIGARWRRDFGRDGVFIPYGGDPQPELPIEPGLVHRGYILVVARFVPENTIPEFFEACKDLAQRHDIVIVGSSGYGGELDEAAAKLAADYPRVKWLGHVSDDKRLFSLWQHAGVYFHGHSVGGTNPALVQAMALGAPIVARDTVYNTEVLGESGIIAAVKRKSIIDALNHILSDGVEQARYSELAKARAADIYSWGSVLAGYENSLATLSTREVKSRRVPSGS
ncbi:glycosyltransferase [Salinibacterium sp. G-O1]|uniref:glycosyltransferase n=1 Tax=Salinibacterium sp. G-O1 TaxID=3046208 RepID=UPI0024BAB683|nr:glycosyltransferase [Salinibacterium sp. G-O1]MDJ0335419.1 glycosyltransferase [Salinibacterium sp. G-O1]